MSKLNKSPAPKTTTLSKDGVVAFKHNEANELCERVLTSFFGEAKFYENGKVSDARLLHLVREVATKDPVFVAKLAVLAREKFNLRSVTQVITAELAKVHRGDALVSAVINRTALRVDDLTDLIAYLIESKSTLKTDIYGKTKHVKTLPAQVRKGISTVFSKFNAYQLGKYKALGKSVKLRDLINLIHPTPVDAEQSAMWKSVLDGTLVTPDTWETALTQAGQTAREEGADSDKLESMKSDVWERMIVDKKLGYMALLRNLRNIIKSGVSPEAHAMAQAYLCNEKAVENSKQMPFRFYSAYKALTADTTLDPFLKKAYIKALNAALYFSGRNYPKMKGRTVLVCDLSQSMNSKLSKMTEVSAKEVGAVLCSIASQFCEEFITIGFGTNLKVIDLNDSPSATLENIKVILDTNVGCNTEANKVMDRLTSENISADNIIFFTDMQLNGGYNNSYNSTVDRYRKEINKDVYIYNLNLVGYGTTQLDPRNNRNIMMSGWSDNVLRYIAEFQELHSGITDMVNAVKLEY